MRERLELHATVFTMVLTLGLSSAAWAQQPAGGGAGKTGRESERGTTQAERGGQNQNQQTQSRNQNQNQSTMRTETIRGTIAGITTEGEVILDYRTNQGARAEGAFLTIVGSPETAKEGHHERGFASNEAHRGLAGKHRHNIYIAWLMPRTKICECTAESAKSGEGAHSNRAPGNTEKRNDKNAQSANDKKEISFDQLEVGEHVELQFAPGEESGSNRGVHQSQQMRQKHGRHRTFVGFATEITVLPAEHHDKDKSGTHAASHERER